MKLIKRNCEFFIDNGEGGEIKVPFFGDADLGNVPLDKKLSSEEFRRVITVSLERCLFKKGDAAYGGDRATRAPEGAEKKPTPPPKASREHIYLAVSLVLVAISIIIMLVGYAQHALWPLLATIYTLSKAWPVGGNNANNK